MADYLCNINKYVGIKNFMDEWKKNQRGKYMLSRWLKQCHIKMDDFVASVNTNFLLLKSTQEYQIYLQLGDVDEVKRCLFEQCMSSRNFETKISRLDVHYEVARTVDTLEVKLTNVSCYLE